MINEIIEEIVKWDCVTLDVMLVDVAFLSPEPDEVGPCLLIEERSGQVALDGREQLVANDMTLW